MSPPPVVLGQPGSGRAVLSGSFRLSPDRWPWGTPPAGRWAAEVTVESPGPGGPPETEVVTERDGGRYRVWRAAGDTLWLDLYPGTVFFAGPPWSAFVRGDTVFAGYQGLALVFAR